TKGRFLTISDVVTNFDVQQELHETDRLKRHLTRLNPEGEVPFPIMLNRATQQMPESGLIIIITTHLDEVLMETVQPLNKRSRQVMIYLVQSADLITVQMERLIRQMRLNGIIVNMLTEQQLARSMPRGECG